MGEVPKKQPDGKVKKPLQWVWEDPQAEMDRFSMIRDLEKAKKIVDLVKKSPEILTMPDNAWEIAIATQEIILGTNESNILYYLDQNLSVAANFKFDFNKPKVGVREALDKWHDDRRKQIKKEYPHVLIDTDLALPWPQFTVTPSKRIMNAYEKSKKHKDVVMQNFEAAFKLTDLYKYLSPSMRARFMKTCVYGQVTTETQWNEKAKSNKNAQGIFQVLPETAAKTAERNQDKLAGLQIDPQKIDLYDPSTCSKIAALYYNRIFSKLKDRFDLIQKEFGYNYKAGFDRDLVIPFLFAAYHSGENKIAEMIDWFMSPQNLPAHKKTIAAFKSKSDIYFYITKQFYYRHELPLGAQGQSGLFGRRSMKYSMTIIANQRLMEAEERQRAKQVAFAEGEDPVSFVKRAAKHNSVEASFNELKGLTIKISNFLNALKYNNFSAGDEIEVGKDDKGIYAKFVLWQLKDVDKRVTRHWIRFSIDSETDLAVLKQKGALFGGTEALPKTKKPSKLKDSSSEKHKKWRWKNRNFHTTRLYRMEYSKLVDHSMGTDGLKVTAGEVLLKRGDLVEVPSKNEDYDLLPMPNSKPYIRPYALYVMRQIAADFRKESGGYKLLVSSLFRTPKGQKKLAQHNSVATKGTSTHFFGNTFDFTITRFVAPNGSHVFTNSKNRHADKRVVILDKILIRYQKKGMAMGYWERPARHVIAAKPKNL